MFIIIYLFKNIDKIINDQEYSAIYSDDVKQSDLAVYYYQEELQAFRN